MNKFVAIAATAAVALGVSLSAIAPSSAAPYNPVVPFAAGVVGFMAGAAAANAANNGPYYRSHYRGDRGWRMHVAACTDAYRSYDPRSDTYVRRVRGQLVRVPCEL